MENLSTSLLSPPELVDAAAQLLPTLRSALGDQSLLIEVSHAAAANAEAIAQTGADRVAEALAQADALRDAAFVALREGAATWAGNPDASEVERQAAARLTGLIARHGNTLHLEDDAEQTAKLIALFAELFQFETAEDLETLSLTAGFDQLVQTQEAFEALVYENSHPDSTQQLPVVAQNAPPLIRRLDLLLGCAAERELLGSSVAIATLNELIRGIMSKVRARQISAGGIVAQAKAASGAG